MKIQFYNSRVDGNPSQELNLYQNAVLWINGHPKIMYLYKIYKNGKVTFSSGYKRRETFKPNSEGKLFIPIDKIK